MTSIRSQKTQQLRRSGLHSLVTLGLLVAIAVGATFAVTSGILDNLDSMSGSNRIAIVSVNAYTDGDRMVISGNLQNLGSQPLTSVIIDEITAGDLVITQNPAISDGNVVDAHGALTLSGLDDAGDLVGPNIHDRSFTATVTAPGTGDAPAGCGAGETPTDDEFFILTADVTAASATGTCTALVTISGLSTDSDELEPLAAGSSKSFRIVIAGDSTGTNTDVLDILRTVPASSELFITVAGTDGQTSTISDPRSVRVQAR